MVVTKNLSRFMPYSAKSGIRSLCMFSENVARFSSISKMFIAFAFMTCAIYVFTLVIRKALKKLTNFC